MSRPIRTTPAGTANVLLVRGVRAGVVLGGVVGVVVGIDVGIASVGVGGVVDIGIDGVGVVGGVFGGVFGGVLGVLVGGVTVVMDVIRERRRGRREAARVGVVSAPASLRLVRGLLPGDEGAEWWAEVNSLLAEAGDPGERRRYVRSYRREVPQLIWTSWAEHLSASDRRELS